MKRSRIAKDNSVETHVTEYSECLDLPQVKASIQKQPARNSQASLPPSAFGREICSCPFSSMYECLLWIWLRLSSSYPEDRAWPMSDKPISSVDAMNVLLDLDGDGLLRVSTVNHKRKRC